MYGNNGWSVFYVICLFSKHNFRLPISGHACKNVLNYPLEFPSLKNRLQTMQKNICSDKAIKAKILSVKYKKQL